MEQMDSQSHDRFDVDLHFQIADLERLRRVLHTLARWRSNLVPDTLQRRCLHEDVGPEPWDPGRQLPTEDFASAAEKSHWSFSRGDEFVSSVRRKPADVTVSLSSSAADVGRPTEVVTELLEMLARDELHPAMITVSRDWFQDGYFGDQGLDELRNLPPILYLDNAALTLLGGDRLRAMIPPNAWRDTDYGALLVWRADIERDPEAADWALHDQIAAALGIAPGYPLVLVGDRRPPVRYRHIEEVDRKARGFERAVLAYSVIGGTPQVLDRTINSLRALEQYCEEVRAPKIETKRVNAVAHYLWMLALETRGVNADVASLGVEQFAERVVHGGGVGDLAARLAALPVGSPLHERVRIIRLKLHVTPWNLDVANRAERAVLAAVPELAELKLDTHDEAEWSLIVDNDEVRVDFSEETIAVTLPIPTTTIADRLQELVRALAPLGAEFGVAYDIDLPSSILYTLRGAPTGRPGWLVEGPQLVDVTTENDPFAKRGREPRWPHRQKRG
jgi:hypothetical protein